MSECKNALRDLMDALLLSKPGLEKIDSNKSIDENVELTNVDERYVTAYLTGEKALKVEE